MRWFLLTLTLLLSTAAIATAQPDPNRRQGSRPSMPPERVYVAIDGASARFDGRTLTVQLKISRDSWRFLAERRIPVTLSASVKDVHVDRKLRSATESVSFAIPLGTDPQNLWVTLTGGGPRAEIGWMVVGGVELLALPLRVTEDVVATQPPAPPGPPGPPPPPPPPTNWAADPRVIKACGDTFEGSTNERACMDAVADARFDPTSSVLSCDAAMEGDPNELACVRLAMTGPGDRTSALLRCDAAMEGDDSELACFRQVMRTAYSPSAMIDACDAAMEGDVNELACITAAAGALSDPTAAIRACDKSMSGDESQLDCVRRAVR